MKRIAYIIGEDYFCLMCGKSIDRFRRSKKTCSDRCRKRLERWKNGRKVQMKLQVKGKDVQW
jgi:predicted nucleic acid-binding Zn ribbon protein